MRRVNALSGYGFKKIHACRGVCAKRLFYLPGPLEVNVLNRKIRNPKQVRMTEIQNQTSIALRDAVVLRFGFRRRLVSDFGIRVSDSDHRSGWWDLNPRAVAAATALLQLFEFIPTSARLVRPLALCCCGPRGERFAVEQNPRQSMFCRLGFTSVVTANSFSQIFARAHVTSPGFLTAQDVTIIHCLTVSGLHWLGGFEPTACRRGDRFTGAYQ